MEDQPMQLTLDVGGEQPSQAALTLSGRSSMVQQLEMGDEIWLRVAGPDGELIAEGRGLVTQVAFKRYEPARGPAFVERIHTVMLR